MVEVKILRPMCCFTRANLWLECLILMKKVVGKVDPLYRAFIVLEAPKDYVEFVCAVLIIDNCIGVSSQAYGL